LEQLNRVLSRRDRPEERSQEIKIYCAEEGNVQNQPKAQAANQKDLDRLRVIAFVVLKSDEGERLNPNHAQAKHSSSVAVGVSHMKATAEVGDHLQKRVVDQTENNVAKDAIKSHEDASKIWVSDILALYNLR